MPNPPSLAAAHKRHRVIREAVYGYLNEELRADGSRIVIRGIDKATAIEAEEWEYPTDLEDRKPNWSWIKRIRRSQKSPCRIEASFWCLDDEGNEVLGGLLCGKVSRSKLNANICLIERNPEKPLELDGQLIAIAARYLAIHGTALGCSSIGIIDPLPVGRVIDAYKGAGFTQEEMKKGMIKRLYMSLTEKENGGIVGMEDL